MAAFTGSDDVFAQGESQFLNPDIVCTHSHSGAKLAGALPVTSDAGPLAAVGIR